MKEISLTRRLEDLPNETLSSIFEWVDLERREAKYLAIQPGDILDLMLCSSRFHVLAEPLLYKHVNITSPKSLVLFLSRLIDRPEHAKRLRTLHVARLSDDKYIVTYNNEVVQSALRCLDWPDEGVETWARAIKDRNWDALIALILLLAPNIEYFGLGNYGYEKFPFTIELFKRAIALQDSGKGSPFAMMRMRNAFIDLWNSESRKRCAIEFFETFLGLQSISSLEVNELCLDSIHLPWLSNPPSSNSSVIDLSLYCSAIGYETMSLIFSRLTALERLRYEYRSTPYGDAVFEPPRMMPAISHVKLCLRDLTILKSANSFWSNVSELSGYCIGSFASFRKLTHIRTLASVMMGDGIEGTCDGFQRSQSLVDGVPPALQYLSLSECGRSVVSNIFELISQKESRAPYLQFLDLGWKVVRYPDKPSSAIPDVHPGFTKEEAERLIMECSSVGVMLKIKDMSPPPKCVVYKRHLKLGQPGSGLATQQFEYPYFGYEDCCRENGCDPATGKPPAADRWLTTRIDMYLANFVQ